MIIPILLVGMSLALLAYILKAPSINKESMEIKKGRRFFFGALIPVNTFLLLILDRFMPFLWVLGILILFTIVVGIIFKKQYKVKM